MNERHVFALYYRSVRSGELVIADAPTIHRLTRVLRLRVGDELTLFDGHVHAEAVVLSLGAREVRLRATVTLPNQVLKPAVTVLLGLLRHDALGVAVASLTEVGVTEIALYTSAKAQRAWGGARELDRLQRIMIASAEQSKQFAMPVVHEPRPLPEIVGRSDAVRILCDPSGSSLVDYAQKNSAVAYTVIVGPEGDLTVQEKSLLAAAGYQACRLTPTILRSEQAAFLAAGIIRSL